MFKMWGADVVGMTLVPEVIFAKEFEIPYASLSICTNYAAGMQRKITMQEVSKTMEDVRPQLSVLLERIISGDAKLHIDKGE